MNIYKQTERKIDGYKDRLIDKQTDRHMDIQTQRQIHRDRYTDKKTK